MLVGDRRERAEQPGTRGSDSGRWMFSRARRQRALLVETMLTQTPYSDFTHIRTHVYTYAYMYEHK